eukprot:717993-Hanusia_phi.AAC.15
MAAGRIRVARQVEAWRRGLFACVRMRTDFTSPARTAGARTGHSCGTLGGGRRRDFASSSQISLELRACQHGVFSGARSISSSPDRPAIPPIWPYGPPLVVRGKLYNKPRQQGGIGLVLEYREKRVFVVGIVKGSAAEETGMVEAGDELVEVDGWKVEGLPPNFIARLMCGPPGMQRSLMLARKGKEGDHAVRQQVLVTTSVPPPLPLEAHGKLSPNAALYGPWGLPREAEEVKKVLPPELQRYACPCCEARFISWRVCIRHLKNARHVKHELLPYMRMPDRQEVWIDR